LIILIEGEKKRASRWGEWTSIEGMEKDARWRMADSGRSGVNEGVEFIEQGVVSCFDKLSLT
jgi:hypothetical protein